MGLAQDHNFNYGINTTHYSPSLGWGVYYYDRFLKLGLSIPVVLPYAYYNVPSGGGVKVNYVLVTTGLNFRLSEKMDYNPRLLVKMSSNSPVQFEVYNQLIWNSVWAGGITVRSAESVSAVLGYTFHPQFNIAYAYDLVLLNGLRRHQYGSHEIGLHYLLPLRNHSKQQKILRVSRKHKCINFDNTKKKRFFKEVEDTFYDRN